MLSVSRLSKIVWPSSVIVKPWQHQLDSLAFAESRFMQNRGAGIFSGAGTAISGGPNHLGAGPALVISYILVALACGFAALCYAEFASLIPQAGSAYTYAYASFGELMAWIIGWDLIIEYAVGNIAVAVSWGAYFQTLLEGFGMGLPDWLATDPRTAKQAFAALQAAGGDIAGAREALEQAEEDPTGGTGWREVLRELVNDGTYRVIERKRLDAILAEQNFANSDRADPSAQSLAKMKTSSIASGCPS